MYTVCIICKVNISGFERLLAPFEQLETRSLVTLILNMDDLTIHFVPGTSLRSGCSARNTEGQVAGWTHWSLWGNHQKWIEMGFSLNGGAQNHSKLIMLNRETRKPTVLVPSFQETPKHGCWIRTSATFRRHKSENHPSKLGSVKSSDPTNLRWWVFSETFFHPTAWFFPLKSSGLFIFSWLLQIHGWDWKLVSPLTDGVAQAWRMAIDYRGVYIPINICIMHTHT